MYNQHGALQRQWMFEQSTIAALAWRPKGAQLAVAGYGGVSLYTPLDENSSPRKLAWKGSMLNLAWSPDAKVIAAGCQDNSVHFVCRICMLVAREISYGCRCGQMWSAGNSEYRLGHFRVALTQ